MQSQFKKNLVQLTYQKKKLHQRIAQAKKSYDEVYKIINPGKGSNKKKHS